MEGEEAKKWADTFEDRLIKDKVRIAFEYGGRHSCTWGAWGRKGEYYLGATSILGQVKISLHASGICRLALNKDHFAFLAKRGFTQIEDRALLKWRRPPTPAIGAALAVVIKFLADYMTLEPPVSTAKKPHTIFGVSGAGMAGELGFFYSREPAESLEAKFLQIGKPIFRTDLDNGEAVWIVVRETAFDLAVLPSISQLSDAKARVFDPDLPIGIEQKNLTTILWNAPKDGEALQAIEVSGLSVIRNT